MARLNVLYTSSNDYAPFFLVSMTSLFENNRDLEEITVYYMCDNVEKKYYNIVNELAKKYQRKVEIIDSINVIERLEQSGISSYRGSHAPNLRLMFPYVIPETVDRLLYLDCDIIIISSLAYLLELDLGNSIVGMCRESIANKYLELIKWPNNEPYCNAGVMLINTKAWIANHITQNILSHDFKYLNRFVNPDQDILNIELKGKIKIILPIYNAQPSIRVFGVENYSKVYGLNNNYSKKELQESIDNPIILHTYQFVGKFPWHKDNVHPDTRSWDKYLKLSPLNDFEKETISLGFLFKIEVFIYKLLPKRLFLRIFKQIHYLSFYFQMKKKRRHE